MVNWQYKKSKKIETNLIFEKSTVNLNKTISYQMKELNKFFYTSIRGHWYFLYSKQVTQLQKKFQFQAKSEKIKNKKSVEIVESVPYPPKMLYIYNGLLFNNNGTCTFL